MIIEEHLQVRSNTLYIYKSYPKKFPTSSEALQQLALLNEKKKQILSEQETYSGLLCEGAKKRVIKAVEMLLQVAEKRIIYNPVIKKHHPFQIGFVTLTVYSPGRIIDGKESHKTCLEPFLQWLRRSHDVNSYIQKAERQYRGQIHYHITIDKFVHYEALRAKWNSLQRSAGYLDDYYNAEGIRDYDPNSTDVHSMKSKKSLSGYLLKYMAKTGKDSKPEDRVPGTDHVYGMMPYASDIPIGGKVWDCSKNLKDNKLFVTDAGRYSPAICKLIETKQIKAAYTEHCVILQTRGPASALLTGTDALEYKAFIKHVAAGKLPEVAVKEDVFIVPAASPEQKRMINAELQEKTKKDLIVKFKLVKNELMNNHYNWTQFKIKETKQFLGRLKAEINELEVLIGNENVSLSG